jgi:hypothetical protein
MGSDCRWRWVWLSVTIVSTVALHPAFCHPPKDKEPKTAKAQGNTPPAAASSSKASGDAFNPEKVNPESVQGRLAASEADRQVAYFEFEYLSELAKRFPTRHQAEVVRQLIDEHRLATGAPAAPSVALLQQRRASLHEALGKQIPVVSALWDGKQIQWDPSPPELSVAEGMTRPVTMVIRNATESPLVVQVVTDEASPSFTILPRLSQPMLLSIPSSVATAKIDLRLGEHNHSLGIPVKASPSAKLIGKLIDEDSRTLTAGRVWVEGSDGVLRLAGPFAEHSSFQEKPILELTVGRMAAVPFFYADGEFEVQVPAGKVQLRLERGFEHAIGYRELEVQPGETRPVQLESQRSIDLKKRGWVSGDTHIHWVTNAWNVDLPLADLALVQRAEDLRVVNNLTLMHRTDVDAFIKPSQAAVGPVARYSDSEYHIEMAEEYRNQNLYGHLCLLNLQWLVLPIGSGPQIAGEDSIDYPINKTIIVEAREQGAISIEAHGVGANHELPLHAVHGLTDSVDQIDPEDYYRLLDCGFQLPLTNGSDHPARIAGCARAYVQVDGDFDYEKWIDGIRRGRTFTTSGPLLLLSVDGKGPGSVIDSPNGQMHRVQLEAFSRFPLGRVQILSNGEVIKELETEQSQVTLECMIPSDTSRWVVARCSRNETYNALWHPDIAHTSAVYLHRDGIAVFREEAFREWMERMRWHRRDVLAKGRFAREAQRQEATDYVDQAIQRYERLLEWRRENLDLSVPDIRRDRLLMQAAFVSPLGHAPEFLEKMKQGSQIGQLREAVKPLTLLKVYINPESRVKLTAASVPSQLVQHRTYRFLVEIHNESGIQAPLRLAALDLAKPDRQAATWASIGIQEHLLSTAALSGAPYEWKIVELRCDEAGDRELHLEADAGQGTQDLGFRASIDLPIRCVPRRSFGSPEG